MQNEKCKMQNNPLMVTLAYCSHCRQSRASSETGGWSSGLKASSMETPASELPDNWENL